MVPKAVEKERELDRAHRYGRDVTVILVGAPVGRPWSSTTSPSGPSSRAPAPSARQRPPVRPVAPHRMMPGFDPALMPAFLTGKEATSANLAEAARLAADAANPQPDQRGPADYKRHLAAELTVRALRRSVERARGRS